MSSFSLLIKMLGQAKNALSQDLMFLHGGGSQEHNLRCQRLEKNSRLETDFSRTDPLETKDRNGRGQGPRTQFF